MATTYTLISSNTLSSSAASVTFSSIPSTYTDLVLRISARTDIASWNANLWLKFNGTTTAYSSTRIYGLTSTAYSDSDTALGYIYQKIDGANATSNTFGSTEIYIPSYTVSQNKPMSGFSVTENNSSTQWLIYATADLWRNTAAISSINISTDVGNYVSGSSFYLYGIKNS